MLVALWLGVEPLTEEQTAWPRRNVPRQSCDVTALDHSRGHERAPMIFSEYRGAMDDTTAPVEALAPNSVFSLADDLATLWVEAYQGEVRGELLFQHLAEGTDDPDHRRKLNVLTRLERRTKEALIPVMERSGLSIEPDPENVAETKVIADVASSMSWADLWASAESITTEFIALYLRIGELADGESEAAQLLVAHEEALRDFARKELANSADTSLDAIWALPHMD
jgi:hypothetical protein